MTGQLIAACRDVTVRYGRGGSAVIALDGVSVEIFAHDCAALLGRSGSGKTTLLHVLGGLVEPTAGIVEWPQGRLDPGPSGPGGLARPRGVAYVFQGANLLPTFSAYENVSFAAVQAGVDPVVAPKALLELVGLGAKLDFLPAELSGGEAQRVAIARALAQTPLLLLCDEPTGHLDSDTGERVLDLLEAVQGKLGFALVIATHDVDVAARFGRRLELHDGRVVRQEQHA